VEKILSWIKTFQLFVGSCSVHRILPTTLPEEGAAKRSIAVLIHYTFDSNNRKYAPSQRLRISSSRMILRLTTIVIVSILCPGISQAGACKALLIANASYQERPLVNPKRDAAIVASALESKKCSVELAFDNSREAVSIRILEITRPMTPQDTFILYYSGHGYEINSNFHMLFETRGIRSIKNSFEEIATLSLFTILSQPAFAKGFTSYFILDACRTSLTISGNEIDHSPNQRMPIIKAPLTILYSTAPGAPAYDNRLRKTSLFSEVLSTQLQLLDASTYSIELALKNTAALVAQHTHFGQQPWISSTASITNGPDEDTTFVKNIRESSKLEASDRLLEIVETPQMTLVVMPRMKATSQDQATQACRNENARLPTVGEARDLADLPYSKTHKVLGLWALGDKERQDRCLMVGGSWHAILPPEPKLVRYVPCIASEQVRTIVCIRTAKQYSNESSSLHLQ
jgi:hypothetical protein